MKNLRMLALAVLMLFTGNVNLMAQSGGSVEDYNRSGAPNGVKAMYVAKVNKMVSTPFHEWTLQQVEYYNNCTICRWHVESLQANTYINMTPGVKLVDNNGGEYSMITSNLTSHTPGVKLSQKGDCYDYYVSFPPVRDGAILVSYVASSSFQVDGIKVGNGKEVRISRPSQDECRSLPKIVVTSVEMTDDYTALRFSLKNYDARGNLTSEGWSIGRGAYIQYGDRQFPLIKAEGIGFSRNNVGRTRTDTTFRLVFSPISKTARQIDFIEPGGWEVRNIKW